MLENLKQLEMTGDTSVETPELIVWSVHKAKGLYSGFPIELQALLSAAIAYGFVYGIAYATEFGIPDCSKNLITVKS